MSTWVWRCRATILGPCSKPRQARPGRGQQRLKSPGRLDTRSVKFRTCDLGRSQELRHSTSRPCAAWSYGTRQRSSAWKPGAEGPRRAASRVGMPRYEALRIASTAASLKDAAQPPDGGLGNRLSALSYRGTDFG